MWTDAPAAHLVLALAEIAQTLPPAPPHVMMLLWGPPQPVPDMAFSMQANVYLGLYDRPSHEICRPFHDGSRGFVLGEGAGVLVLSNPNSGAEPYADLLSTALGNDAYHPVAIEPSHVHSHLGAHASGCGLKPLRGHSMAAASLLDAVVLSRALTERALPVHGQLDGARVPAPASQALSAVARRLPHGSGHGPQRLPDRGDSLRRDRDSSAPVVDELPLTSSHTDPETGAEDLLPLGADPCLQLSLGFAGNICAATYGAGPT